MQNWQVLQEKLSKMNKDEFIDFIRIADRSAIHRYAELCDTEKSCLKTNCYKTNKRCIDCIIDLLEEEYQPPKQEKWIVHRTLRTQNKETYIGNDNSNTYKVIVDEWDSFNATYKKEKATRYKLKDAIEIRDMLNRDRQGKQYLWVISKVEE